MSNSTIVSLEKKLHRRPIDEACLECVQVNQMRSRAFIDNRHDCSRSNRPVRLFHCGPMIFICKLHHAVESPSAFPMASKIACSLPSVSTKPWPPILLCTSYRKQVVGTV